MSTAAAKRRTSIASTLVVALVAGLLVWLAARSDGEVVRKTDLNDGGIWVTNAEQSRFGRINKAAGQLDAGVFADVGPSSGLDVLQDGAAVVGLTRATNQIVPIDPAQGTLAPEQAIVLPRPSTATGNRVFATPPVDLRGGTVAMVDPATGALRAQRVDERAGVMTLEGLQTQARPLATVGGAAAVAVGHDGSVYAVSARKGTVTVLRPQGDRLGAPATTALGFTSTSAQVTAVGSHWVVWDAATNRLYSDALEQPRQLSVGAAQPGSQAYAALQQPGPDASAVLVQDARSLTQVPLTDDAAPAGGVTVAQASAGENLLPSAPVRLGACVHAAWAGPSNVYYGRNCGSPADAGTVDLGAMRKGVRTDGVALRVNRGLVVLNDLDSGDVWDVDRDRVKIDNWNAVIPPPQTDDRNRRKDENLLDDEQSRTPPKAQPDSVQVRAGRTSTLHVLDNDSDSQGSILAIAPGDVTDPDVPGISAMASADGQTVQVVVPEEPGVRTFGFTYAVNNGTGGRNGRATARVTVRVVGDDVNTAPRLRGGQAKLARSRYPVVPDGSVRVGVVADWRDAENDPIQVSPVDPATTGVDGSGALTVKAQGDKGDQLVEYTVDDGRGGTAKDSVTLQVLGEDDDKPVRPRTQPDVVRAVVGKPVQLQPLGNDVAGADPTDPEARMRLAEAVRGPGQLVLDTNLDTGVLTVTGRTPGTSTVTYAAQVGSGVSKGRVRVDILPATDDDTPPVATPDTAVVRGQTPVVADVLSNDYSPRSDVLVVQRVTTGDAWLRASVVQGRWVRVEATAPLQGSKARRGSVSYTISDGTKSAVGQLSVVQKPEPEDQVLPTVVDDVAVVRSGDAVTIPALDNDSMSEGIPLRLDPNGVRVVSGGGQAFASGTVVRYVPEASRATGPRTAVLEYSAFPEGLRARAVTGRVTVTITPPPDAVRNPNRPPSARSFSASVTAGDTLAITVPTSGVDPDGDLTFVSGIVGDDGGPVALRLGRVLGFGAATIRYEAYPRSAGTEVIRYQLRDRFGATSEGFVRVGVVQPGDPQPPVAVEDDVVAAPGRTVRADVLTNDLVAAGDAVSFVDLTSLNDADVLRQFTKQSDDTFKVVAPEEGPAKVLTYGITDGLFDPSKSTLTVRGQRNFTNPPVAVDDTASAKPGETSVLVDVLANDRDLDGPQSSLDVVRFYGDGVTAEGRKLRIQLRPTARVVPYVIADADGAQAMALVYVPAGSNGSPYVVQGRTVKMGSDSTVTVPLADYVADPRGGRVSLTSPDTVSTSPSADLQFDVSSATSLTLTSTNGYAGPAALMLEVTNATGPGDRAAQTAYVTIPVQVGADVPVLRCPDHEVRLVADGPARSVDVPRLCHAWLPGGLDAGAARYEASWDRQVEDVELSQSGAGGRQVDLRAGPAARAGATGTVTLRARGGSDSFPLRVRVVSSPPGATLRPARVEGLVAGTSRQVDLAQFLDSPLSAPQCALTGARVVSGTGVTASRSGCTLTVAASSAARGDARVGVTVVDAPGRPPAVGEVSVSVRSRPDPTAAPTAVADRVLGGTARVDWRPPAYDGGLPVQGYEVVGNDGEVRQACSSAPCTITGLTNGKDYTFTVRSRNAVDWSEPSPPSATVRPDTKPRATSVTDVVPGDRRLTVRWTAPQNEGSPVTAYRVQWVDVGAGAGATGTATVTAPTLSRLVTGLVNDDAYTVRVQARNGAGWGPFGPAVKAQSFGKPPAVPAPTLDPRTPSPGAADAQVAISWPATDPNGPPITRYEVYRRTGSGAWTLIATRSGGESRTASDSVPYQGQTVEYTVTATNGGPATSDRANFRGYQANGYPQTPTLTSVRTPTDDKRGVAAFTLGDPRSQGYSRVEWRTSTGAGGSWSCSGGCSGGTTTKVAPQAQTLEIRACNVASYCSPWSNAVTFRPYGPTLGAGSVRTSHTDSSITFRWSKPADNGNAIQGYRVSRTSGGSGCGSNLGPNQTSCTVSGLGYSKTITLRVTPYANRSGNGPTSSGSDTTNPKPPPPKPSVDSVYHGAATGYISGCDSGKCYRIGYRLSNFQGSIRCFITTDTYPGDYPYNWDDGTRGSHQPVNGANQSSKFYGFRDGYVKVACTGSNGTASATKNPWGF